MQENSSAGRSSVVSGSLRQTRSRITNGTALLPTADLRSPWARVMRDVYRAVIQHCGSDDVVSELERMAARRIGALEAELVFMEDKFATLRAAGGEPDAGSLDLYSRLSNTHRRHCESVGWQRRPRDVTPTPHLRHYLHARAEADAELIGEQNVTDPGPTSSGVGNRTSEAPARDLRPLEGDQDGTG